MKNICTAILAHVDAGKTTLSEALLYVTGMTRKLGRVDRQDAFLDTNALERARGITIFSKQAILKINDNFSVTLLDTPGHVDFSAEMERTLGVLDYAVLVISGADGVQGHTRTLWSLLRRYQVPVFLFVNKMDQDGTDKERLLSELKEKLDDNCVDFTDTASEEFMENVAVCDETLLERYLEKGVLEQAIIMSLIRERKLFPCYFGSALKMQGVKEFLDGFLSYTRLTKYPKDFGAKVFKIARDAQGNRLTYLKITGGSLKVKQMLNGQKKAGFGAALENEDWEEKVNQIRIYSGEKYETAEEVEAGCICAVTGLNFTYPGQGLGAEKALGLPVLEPVLTYQLLLPEECNPAVVMPKLRELEEEEPELHIVWNETLKEIQAQLMGEVQIEVIKSLIEERFGIAVEFGAGNIVYKETIASVAEGVGHFEPLRHYAEVHLLLEPLDAGSGLVFDTDCSEDVLDRNWQRLILTHLQEREHVGVLTGSPITDMKITLVTGKAHLKHTEGGDFRQATYRALRQGLMQAESVLLEPYYQFQLEVPGNMVGRAMTDIEQMHGTISYDMFFPENTKHGNKTQGKPAETMQMPGKEGKNGSRNDSVKIASEHGVMPGDLGGGSYAGGYETEMRTLTGIAPVAAMQNYQREVIAYTKGQGRLFCTLEGYHPCHNAEKVMEQYAYDPKRDLENPTGSVFCSHGAGIAISWDEVYKHMHLPSCLEEKKKMKKINGGLNDFLESSQGDVLREAAQKVNAFRSGHEGGQAGEVFIGTEEIDKILDQTYNANKKSNSYESRNQWKKKGGRKDKESVSAVTRNYNERNSESNVQTKGNISESTGSYASGNSGSKGEIQGSAVAKNDNPQKKGEYLLVDGYNIIFAWDDLKELAAKNIDGARGRLLDILCNYQGICGCELIVVFDAYRVQGHQTEILDYHNIHVVYTKEAETADQYIEKFAHEHAKKYRVVVATSDGLEQIIIRGAGCQLLSARDLQEEVIRRNREMQEQLKENTKGRKNYLLDKETLAQLKESGVLKEQNT